MRIGDFIPGIGSIVGWVTNANSNITETIINVDRTLDESGARAFIDVQGQWLRETCRLQEEKAKWSAISQPRICFNCGYECLSQR